ncbi:MAG: hypothetical protein GX805_10085 [Gammaproteobacteria bacterium]|nr:hypothetical protein [Gammaproteobacteria bacterium]
MKTMTRLLLSACLVLPLAACQQEEEVQVTETAPLSAPATDDRNEWRAYLNDVVGRNMEGIYNQPYVYLVPPARDTAADVPETADGAEAVEGAEVAEGTVGPELVEGTEAADAEYFRLAERAEMDLARGIVRGNLLAYAGADSGRVADLVVRAFEDVPEATMDGVRVLFIGDQADSERVQQAVAASGVEYIFIQK